VPTQSQHQQAHQSRQTFVSTDSTPSFAATPSMVPAPLFATNMAHASSLSRASTVTQGSMQRSNTIRRSSLDRELPPPPPAPESAVTFDYIPNTQIFEDWNSLGSTIVEEPTPSDGIQGGMPAGMQMAQGMDWNMIQYFGPGVAQ
jgi:hypothetical protein